MNAHQETRRTLPTVSKALESLRRLKLLPWSLKMGFTVAAVLLTGAARESIPGHLHSHPYLLFLPAIMLAGVLFNSGAGFVAAGLSILACMWFVEPDGSLAVDRAEILPLSVFAPIAIFAAAAAEFVRLSSEWRLQPEKAPALAPRGPPPESSTHRIRNDLGVLANYLILQSRQHPEAACVLNVAASQVRLLGQVHKQSAALGGVIADDMLSELGRNLRAAPPACGPVQLIVEADRSRLPLETATTLGLIVNELVTQALDRPIPDGGGSIRITFRQEGGRHVLRVADERKGAGANDQEAAGHPLVRRLAQQLGGQFRSESRGPNRGGAATVTFPVKTPNA